MENSNELKIKHSMPLEELAAYLKDISETLGKGQTCLQYDSKFITLHPAKEVEVKIQAEQKKGKERLSLELSWHLAEEKSKPNGFKITASEPEPEEEAASEASGQTGAKAAKAEKKAKKPKQKKDKKPAAKPEAVAAAP